MTITLREKCPDTELFLVRIFLYSEYGEILSVFGHFSRSVMTNNSEKLFKVLHEKMQKSNIMRTAILMAYQ